MPNYMLHDINFLAEEAANWVKETFPLKVYTSEQERALRTLEEALELAQACGVFRDQAVLLTEHVFSKPKSNDPQRELLDVFFCLLIHSHLYKMQLGEDIKKVMDEVWLNDSMLRIQEKWEGKLNKGLTAFKPGESLFDKTETAL